MIKHTVSTKLSNDITGLFLYCISVMDLRVKFIYFPLYNNIFICNIVKPIRYTNSLLLGNASVILAGNLT